MSTPCWNCSRPVPDGAAACPFCGAPRTGAIATQTTSVLGGTFFGEPAGVGARLLALTVDIAVIVVPAVVIGFLAHSALLGVVTALEIFLVLVVVLGRTGASPGFALLRLRVSQAERPDSPGLGRALVRSLVLALSGVAVVGPWIIEATGGADRSGRRRSLADRAAGTVVARIPDAELRQDAVAVAERTAHAAASRKRQAPAPLIPAAPSVQPAPGEPAAAPAVAPAPAAPRPMSTPVIAAPTSPDAPASETGGAPSSGAPALMRPPLSELPPGFPQPAPAEAPPADVPATRRRSATPLEVPEMPQAPTIPEAVPAPVAEQPSSTTDAAPSAPGEPAPGPRRRRSGAPGAAAPSAPSFSHVDDHEALGVDGLLLIFDTGQRERLPVPVSAVLGRAPQGTSPDDLVIAVTDPDRTISKNHIQLEQSRRGTWITDLASTNGTFLIGEDGAEIPVAAGTRTEVADGVRVRIGDRSFTVSRLMGEAS